MNGAPSLARRLLVLVLALVGATWLGAAVYTWIDVRHELDELLDGHLAQAAALLVVQASDFDAEDDDEVPESPVLHRYAPRVAFQVFHEGQLVRRSANAPATPMVPPGQRVRHGFAQVDIDGEPWRVFVARGSDSDVRVYVGEHRHSRDAILWAVLRGTLWPLALALLVLLALGLEFRARLALALAVAAVLWWQVARAGPAARPSMPAVVGWLSRISYAVFLVHYPVCLVVNAAFERWLPHEPAVQAAGVLLAWASSVAAGAAFHRGVEAPLGRWAQRLPPRGA